MQVERESRPGSQGWGCCPISNRAAKIKHRFKKVLSQEYQREMYASLGEELVKAYKISWDVDSFENPESSCAGTARIGPARSQSVLTNHCYRLPAAAPAKCWGQELCHHPGTCLPFVTLKKNVAFIFFLEQLYISIYVEQNIEQMN